MKENSAVIIEPLIDDEFVITPYLRDILESASMYMHAGYPIHFCGPAGTGKTSLAMYLAAKFRRPIVMMHGDNEFVTSDLIGAEHGIRSRKVVDNFIHHVYKTEEHIDRQWIDKRLSLACKKGFTLIYDEFTRSKPEANNVLLSILEERMLDLPGQVKGEVYIKVHPEFRAIFTSNPREYVGIHRAQDALLDRMITIDLQHLDKETEIRITQKRSGVSFVQAKKIVSIVREFYAKHENKKMSTLRDSIKIGKIMKLMNTTPSKSQNRFRKLCIDVLTSDPHIHKFNGAPKTQSLKYLDELIEVYC